MSTTGKFKIGDLVHWQKQGSTSPITGNTYGTIVGFKDDRAVIKNLAGTFMILLTELKSGVM